MSIKLMTMVWGLDLSHDEQSIMLALADHADDDGFHCYPSVAYIAWKCGYSERSVQRILRKLETAELIKAKRYRKGGRGHATEYRVMPWKGVKKAPFQRENKDDEMAPFEDDEDNRASSVAERVPNPVEHATPVSPQPSVNRQESKNVVAPSESISRDMALDLTWKRMTYGIELPKDVARSLPAIYPLSWTDGVLTLHAPSHLARRKRLADELRQRLAPVAPRELREVRLVNGG